MSIRGGTRVVSCFGGISAPLKHKGDIMGVKPELHLTRIPTFVIVQSSLFELTIFEYYFRGGKGMKGKRQSLIKQNVRDELCSDLDNMKRERSSVNEEREIARKIEQHTTRLKESFSRLCETQFGVSVEQVLLLEEPKFRELEHMVEKRTRAWSWANKFLCVPASPVILFLICTLCPLFDGFQGEARPGMAWQFTHNLSQLRKYVSRDYSLYHAFTRRALFPKHSHGALP